MEYALLGGVFLLVGIVAYWVWRGASSEAREEAFKVNNKELEGRVKAQDQLIIEVVEGQLQEDKGRVESADTAGLRDELRRLGKNRNPN